MSNVNFDASGPNNTANAVQYLLNTVQSLQQKVTSHDDIIAELIALRSENASLKNEIAHLNAKLQSALSGSVPNAAEVKTPTTSSNVQMNEHVPTAIIPSYAAAASRGAARPVSKKRKLAAVRELMPVDPSAPKGFEYLYLHRRRKLSRAVVRQTLRHLGVDLSRVLDICFPGPKVIGVLVHLQYKPEVVSLLATAKVPLVDGFDPLDPVNLADPELQGLSAAVKTNKCAELQYDRCTRALVRLSTGRAHLVGPVGKYFTSLGWMDDETVSQVLKSAPGSPSSQGSHDPGAVFRGDTEMTDAMAISPSSSGAEPHSQ
ncbi:hypothetical protein G6F56_010701 [Rhizopus delemar]|nr:hypothetical protein G6F56_010701 [Rhizopus delemar]